MTDEAAPLPARWTNWLLPLAVFVLLAGVSIAWWQHQRQRDFGEWQLSLNRDSAAHTLEIAERLKLHANFLRTLAAFAEISKPDPQTWQRLSAELDSGRDLPGLLTIAYAPAVMHPEQANLLHRTPPRHHAGDFRSPTSAAELALPLVFAHPGNGHSTTLPGFDLLSQAALRDAVDHAISTRDVTLSGRISWPFDDAGTQPVVLLLRAIYRENAPVNTVVERRQAFTGIVVAAYRLDLLMDSLNGSFRSRFRLQITDHGSLSRGLLDQPAEILYDSESSRGGQIRERIGHELDFGQRTWQLDFIPLADEPRASSFNAQGLAGGLLISLLLALLVFHLGTRRQRALSYVDQLDQELRLSEERFRLAVAGSNDGLWDQNLLTGEDYTSARLAEIFGYAADAAPRGSNHYFRHVHPDDEVLRRAALRQHFRNHTPYDVELRIQRADGKPAWIRLRGEARRDDDGRPYRIAGSVSDITARRLAEDALAELRHLLSTILSALPLPVFVLDGKRQPVMANPAACTLLTGDEAALRRQRWPELLLHTPDNERQRLLQACQRLLDGGSCETIEFLFNKSDGGVRHMVAHHAHAVAPQGQPLLVTVLSDVSELRQAERELLSHRDHLRDLVAARTARLDEALKEARAASAAKSEFLANMSHELRTPMHAILSFAHLGQNRCQEERIRSYFHHIGQSAERLLSLINDLLDLSKLEADAIELALSRCPLGPLLQRVVVQLEPLWQGKGLQVETSGELDTEAEIDVQRIEQVMLNLLANAIKFSPAGAPVELRVRSGSLPYGRRAGDIGMQAAVCIEILDRGVGIPPGEEERIFDKFVQSSLTRTGAGGTGLGLAICQEIVGRHRGTISASNRPDGGACFTVNLPVTTVNGNAA